MPTPHAIPWRISLPTLFVLTSFVAVAVGAMRNAYEWWLAVIATVSLLLLPTAAVVG